MAILIGLEASFPDVTALATAQNLILWVFLAEVGLKLSSEGRAPQLYFYNPWNLFDFIVTAIALVSLFGQVSFTFHNDSHVLFLRIRILQCFHLPIISFAPIDEIFQ